MMKSITLSAELTPGVTARLLNYFFPGLFLAAFVLVGLKTVGSIPALDQTGWPEALLVLAATGSLVKAMSGQLPFQNVLLASVIVGLIGGFVQTIGTLTAFPFGPCFYTDRAGPRLFNVLPWVIPFLWIIAILTSRGVARLVLRPWRKTRVYGFWVIGLTTALTLALDLGLEPFATRTSHYWRRQPTQFPFDWFGTPLTHFVGWLLTTLLILIFTTPVLISKKPGNPLPDYHPLVVWILINLLFIAGALAHQLWPAAAFSLLASLMIAVFAIRGARR
jgi:uncharacterized membrane protein